MNTLVKISAVWQLKSPRNRLIKNKSEIHVEGNAHRFNIVCVPVTVRTEWDSI